MKNSILLRRLPALLLLGAILLPLRLYSHGFEGDRFFPPTVATDDPFATDEFSLGFSSFNNPADDSGPKTREIDLGSEFDKEIFPKFALGIAGTYVDLQPTKHVDPGTQAAPSQDGFANITLSAKYQLFEDAPHEFILSLGGEANLGGSGSRALGVDSFTTYTPTVYFGKGLGDLPDALRYARPLALTGTVGYDIPSKTLDPNSIEWGLALEYSLPYLQQHVEDIGLPHPVSDLIPLVEFSMDTPTNRQGGHTTGTINPGVLYESRDFQVGVEANIPVNAETGPNVGATVQVQIYIDDLWPKVFGHPVFFTDHQNP